MAVVDASVIVALANTHELHHNQCRAWFRDMARRNKSIFAPAILLAEVGAALSRGMDDPKTGHQMREFLIESKLITLQPISLDLAKQAALIAINQRIRGCDAIYVALAQQLEEPLITLDNQQLNRSKDLIAVYAP